MYLKFIFKNLRLFYNPGNLWWTIMIIAYLLCGVLFIAFYLLLLAAFSYRRLPSPLQARTQTHTLPPNPDGVLSSHILKANAQNPNLTGIYGFGSGQDAFAARISLVEAAEY